MNKKFKNLSKLILFILILFPLNVFADTGRYNTVMVYTSQFTAAKTGRYYLSSGKTHNFDGQYDLNIHQVTANGKHYIGYCLHAGKGVVDNVTVTKKTNTKAVDSNGKTLSDETQEVLQNILASGYHKKDLSTDFNGSIVNYNNSEKKDLKGTCVGKNVCKKILATQILIWETMEGSRTCPKNSSTCDPYDPEKLKSLKNSTYYYVKSDKRSSDGKINSLYDYYKEILREAKSLTDSGIPNDMKNNKTFDLKWNDKKGYVSDWFNRGDYTFSVIQKGLSVESCKTSKDSFCKNHKNYVRIISKSPFEGTKDFQLKLTRGSTTTDSKKFVWYTFGDNRYQDVILGDYSKTYTINIHAKVVGGEFKLTKKSAGSNAALKGSKFRVYKCSDKTCKTKSKIYDINLTENATSGAYKIYKSEIYYFEEYVIPRGYDNSNKNYHFTVQFDIDSKGNVTAKVSNSTMFAVTVSNDKTPVITLNAYNAKNIKIKKIDGKTQTALKGTKFVIRKYVDDKTQGTTIKFKKLGNSYVYASNQSESNLASYLVNSSLSEYTIIGLPKGEYYIKEIAAPSPYSLPPHNDGLITRFKMDSNANLYLYDYTANSGKGAYSKKASSTATVTVKNFKTAFRLEKIGRNNTKLKGVVFSLYESDKKTKKSLWTTQYGSVYSYVKPSTDTAPNAKQVSEFVTNSKGRIQILYLPVGTYWVKEVRTLESEGYQIDESIQWVQIKVVVERNNSYVLFKRENETKWTNLGYNGIYSWPNTTGEFCFYKIDEDGNFLTDGKFKIQMYDEKTSKYNDVALRFNKDEQNYSIDSKGNQYTFSPIKDGETCFVNVKTQGKYKIVEIEAPEGYELSSANETSAEFEVNKNGYVIGNTTIINKKKVTGEGAEDQAELIINISTGQNVIRYGLIITVIAVAIIGLLILNKKMSKK